MRGVGGGETILLVIVVLTFPAEFAVLLYSCRVDVLLATECRLRAAECRSRLHVRLRAAECRSCFSARLHVTARGRVSFASPRASAGGGVSVASQCASLRATACNRETRVLGVRPREIDALQLLCAIDRCSAAAGWLAALYIP